MKLLVLAAVAAAAIGLPQPGPAPLVADHCVNAGPIAVDGQQVIPYVQQCVPVA